MNSTKNVQHERRLTDAVHSLQSICTQWNPDMYPVEPRYPVEPGYVPSGTAARQRDNHKTMRIFS